MTQPLTFLGRCATPTALEMLGTAQGKAACLIATPLNVLPIHGWPQLLVQHYFSSPSPFHTDPPFLCLHHFQGAAQRKQEKKHLLVQLRSLEPNVMNFPINFPIVFSSPHPHFPFSLSFYFHPPHFTHWIPPPSFGSGSLCHSSMIPISPSLLIRIQ